MCESGFPRAWLRSHAPTWLYTSQNRPSSVARERSATGSTDATGCSQLRGSLSGTGFANDSEPYRTGSNDLSATTVIGLAVIPTHTSPLRMNCLCDSAQPILRSNRFDGLSGSTITLPLKCRIDFGRRTSMRVVYGAPGVRTTAGPVCG